MRLLLDQDIYASTARFLRTLGHDVLLASEVGLAQAEDEELLLVAQEQGRIFLTRDRDFGHLVFVRRVGAGVLYLRLLPTMQEAVHSELERVLQTYTAEELVRAFVVIEAGRHRIRRPLEE